MAFTQRDILAPDSVRTPGLTTVLIERGILQALSVVALSPGAEPAQTWCEIGLISQGAAATSKIAVLAQGYIGIGASLGWTGTLNMEPGYQVYAELASSVTLLARFSILTSLP